MIIKCRKKKPAPVVSKQVNEVKTGHRVINPKDDPHVLYVEIDSNRILRNARRRLLK